MPVSNSIQKLFDAEIVWMGEVSGRSWFAFHNAERCELRINDFPDEPLFTLTWRGESIDFDTRPPTWKVPFHDGA